MKTYTQIHIHAIFAVKNRKCLIHESWRNDLYRYISGIIHNQGHRLLAINGMPDHIHIFFGMRPDQSLSDLMQDIKADSSKWINRSGFLTSHFLWQESFGAFSYSRSQTDRVVRYIHNQEQHHRKIVFREEYLEFLRRFGIEYDPRNILKDPE